MSALLEIANVSKRFGGLQALSDVGIEIHRGQIVGLIGPNGAGKTTFFNVITGLYQADSGSFVLDGKPYKPSAPHLVAKVGIARTFQNIRLFGEMSALENVMVGRHVRSHQGVFGAVLRHAAARREEAAIRERAMSYWTSSALRNSRNVHLACYRMGINVVWKSRARLPQILSYSRSMNLRRA
jgi:branched-chain amino acid transport system ATP-binding protein